MLPIIQLWLQATISAAQDRPGTVALLLIVGVALALAWALWASLPKGEEHAPNDPRP